MSKRASWNKDSITCHFNLREDITEIYEAQAKYAGMAYRRFLDNLNEGKIDKFVFSLLDDKAFEKCFKMKKEEGKRFST